MDQEVQSQESWTSSIQAEAVNTDFVVPESSVANNADAEFACAIGAISLGTGDPSGQPPDEIRPYSSRGPTSDGRMKPDLVAPDGVSVTGNGGFGDEVDGKIIFEGTSAAAPHAAGVAALLLQADESLTPEALTATLQQSRALSPPQVADILSSAAIDLGPAGPDNTFGFGRIDAFAAVRSVVEAGPSPSADGDGGCSIGSSATTGTTFVNVLLPIIILLGIGLVGRFIRIH